MTSQSEVVQCMQRMKLECEELCRVLLLARCHIARLRDPAIREEALPKAEKDMTETLRMTEEATNTIMGAAEEMMALDFSDPAVAETKVMDGCIRVIEACSFQDITGQRISNVLETLNLLEARLAHIDEAWGEIDEALPEEGVSLVDKRTGDEALLNGPSLPGEGLAQEQADRLMKPAARKKTQAG